MGCGASTQPYQRPDVDAEAPPPTATPPPAAAPELAPAEPTLAKVKIGDGSRVPIQVAAYAAPEADGSSSRSAKEPCKVSCNESVEAPNTVFDKENILEAKRGDFMPVTCHHHPLLPWKCPDGTVWGCDCGVYCGKASGNSTRYRCNECDYDLCYGCAEFHRVSEDTVAKAKCHFDDHVLLRTDDARKDWSCGRCGTPAQSSLSWRCDVCDDYRLCDSCLKTSSSELKEKGGVFAGVEAVIGPYEKIMRELGLGDDGPDNEPADKGPADNKPAKPWYESGAWLRQTCEKPSTGERCPASPGVLDHERLRMPVSTSLPRVTHPRPKAMGDV